MPAQSRLRQQVVNPAPSCAFLRYAGIGKARSRLVLPGWVMDAFESPLFPDFGSLDKRSAFPARLSSVHRIKSVLPADSIKTEHQNDHFDHFDHFYG
jgi:hypothetical protein